MALTKTQVSQFYVSIFNRASEGEGNSFWQSASATNSDEAIANEMLATQAAKDYFGSSLDTDQAFIEHIYLNTLSKTVATDPTGIAFWVNGLAQGFSRGFIVSELVKAATVAANAGAAQDQFNNRVTVSDYTADNLAAAPSDLTTLDFATGLTVTNDAATVTSSQQQIDLMVIGSSTTFTLTAAADSVLEGNVLTFTVTADKAVTEDTQVTFDVVPSNTSAADQGTNDTNLNDFAAGTFNPTTVTISAGSTTATFDVTGAGDSFTELPENYSVKASIGTTELTKTVQLLDGSATFTLTTAADNISGTTGDDQFNGLRAATVAAATDTLTAVDIIDGGTGTDTITVTNTATSADATGGALISNVEIFNVRSTAGTATLDASNIAGLTTVNSHLSAGNVTVTNLASGATIGVVGNGTVAQGTTQFAYATATDAQTIAISGGTKQGNVTATASAGVTTVTVNSTGSTANKIGTLTLDIAPANTVTALTVNANAGLTATLVANDFAATAALTVTGAASTAFSGSLAAVDLGANFDGKTIDASAMTAGGVAASLNANTTSFKGGAGTDAVTSAAIGTTTAGAVDAGAGTDWLILNASTDADTAAEAGLFTNFETLRIGNFSQDASLISGITAIELDGLAGGDTISKLNATQAAAVTAISTISGVTLALETATGTSDALALNLSSSTATTNVDATTLTVDGFETMTVNATTGTSGTDSDISFTSADKLTALTITGSADVAVVGTNTAKAVTLDATAVTGDVTVSGNFVNASTISTEAGKDTFTLGTGFGTYNSGANDDAFSGTVAQINTAASFNILNAGAGTDTLTISDGAASAITIVDNNLSKLDGFEKIIITDTTTGAQSITTGGFFDNNWKASGIDLTTASTTGNITIDMTSFTGNATISATPTTGVINIQTGSGDDKVTVAAGATNVVKTYAGSDTIIGGIVAETITAGTGADTITGGGTAANTYVFAAGDSASTAFDTITDFTAIGANVIDAGAASIVVSAAASAGNAKITAAGVATFVTSDDTFDERVTAIDAAIAETGNAAGAGAMWQQGNDAFLFISDGTDGVSANDLVIKLTGLDTTAAAFDTLTDGGTTFTIA